LVRSTSFVCNALGVLWQLEVAQALGQLALEDAGVRAFRLHGSVTDPSRIDRWSDVDALVESSQPLQLQDWLARFGEIWTFQFQGSTDSHVCRVVLVDGRRIDLTVCGPEPRPPNSSVCPSLRSIRFDAALAAVKLGRSDRLIGTHLALEVARATLVLAMQLRDRDMGTALHRSGSSQDDVAGEVAELITRSTDPRDWLPPLTALINRVHGALHPDEMTEDVNARWRPLRILLGGESGPEH
jgi:Streptomycin adenylyltransferase